MKATRSKPVNSPAVALFERPWVCAALLTLLVLVVYYPVFQFGFVSYDDDSYIYQNGAVQAGLSMEGLRWACQSQFNGNWHPLLWLTFMLDSTLYQMHPAGFHATNLLLHMGATLLLFAAWREMTAASGRSLALAALFAAHPLGVEAVAWISERKGTLSTLFWMLALYAYARYAHSNRKRWMLLTVLATCCGLLSKAMLVSLPLALLLLDYWPLRRWGSKTTRQLLWEKIPLFVLVAIFSVIAFQSQLVSGGLSGKADVPAIDRFTRVGVAYWIYLRKAIWPLDLAANYAPPTESIPWALAIPAWIGLVAITLIAWRIRHRAPYLTVGWFWYVITFLPVIGITPVGIQWMADRYAVIPMLGIWLAAVWGIAEAVAAGKIPRRATYGVAIVAGLFFVSLAMRQVWFWHDSLTLFQRVVEVEPTNAIGHRSLGAAYGNQGNFDQAVEHFRTAVNHSPDYALALADLGQALLKLNQPREAIPYLERSLKIRPEDPITLYQFALAHLQLGENAQAIAPLKKCLEIAPEQPNVHHDLGLALAQQGQLAEAKAHWETTLRQQPDHVFAHAHLARWLANSGNLGEACKHYERAIELAPEWPQPVEELAWVLAVTDNPRYRNPRRAIELAQQGEQRFGATPQLLADLAAAVAAQGDYKTAVRLAARATTMAEQASLLKLAAVFKQQEQEYQSGKLVPKRIEFPWK